MHCESVTVADGPSLLFIDAPGNSMGSVQVWFRAGSALEQAHNRGIAHFLEHMFFKGSAQRSGDEIAQQVESFGGELNAFTSFDYTCYYINTPVPHISTAIDILMDMVSAPLFREEDILPEKDVVLEEYLGSLDSPQDYAFYQLQKNCFPRGYAHPILGNEKTIKNFHRDQLVDFRNKFYNRNNCLLLVAGDINDKNLLLDIIQRYSIPAGKKNSLPSFRLKSQSQTSIHARDVHHCQLNLAISAPHFQYPHIPAEDLAMACLGYGESSPLYKHLVTKNTLANRAHTATTLMAKGGFHSLQTTFPYENLENVLFQIHDILTQTVAQGFSHEDIRKAKNQYLDAKIYDKESLESFAFSRGQDYAQTGDYNSEEYYLERIKKTTTNYINQNFQTLLSRPIHTILQIPQQENIQSAQKLISSFEKKMSKLNKTGLSKKTLKRKAITQSHFDPKVKKTILKEGITFLHRHNLSSPTFIIHAYISSGHSFEKKDAQGSHALIGQLLTCGHSGIPLGKFKESMDNYSATLNGFAGKNAYGLTMHGQSRHFDELVEHFCRCLLSSDMKPTQISHFKKIFLRTLQQREKDPYHTCMKKVNQIMFEGHPYSQESLGTPATLRKIKQKDLLCLHNDNIKKKNILISCFGDIEYSQAISTLEPFFSSLPKRNFRFKKRNFKTPSDQYFHIPLEREQVYFFTGIPTGGFDSKENIHLKILTTHLSRFSSDLFIEMREKQGLCYSSYPIQMNALEGGYWGLYVASSVYKADLAINTLKNIVIQLQKHGLTEKNFYTAKNIIEGKEQMLLQTNEDYANVHSLATLCGHGLDCHYKELDTIKKMNYTDFQSQLKKILSKKWSDVRVGYETNLQG